MNLRFLTHVGSSTIDYFAICLVCDFKKTVNRGSKISYVRRTKYRATYCFWIPSFQGGTWRWWPINNNYHPAVTYLSIYPFDYTIWSFLIMLEINTRVGILLCLKLILSQLMLLFLEFHVLHSLAMGFCFLTSISLPTCSVIKILLTRLSISFVPINIKDMWVLTPIVSWNSMLLFKEVCSTVLLSIKHVFIYLIAGNDVEWQDIKNI